MAEALEWWRPAKEPPIATQVTLRDVWACLTQRHGQYLRVKYDGAHCVVTLLEGLQILCDSEPGEYEFELVAMTRWEFERLPEFEGF